MSGRLPLQFPPPVLLGKISWTLNQAFGEHLLALPLGDSAPVDTPRPFSWSEIHVKLTFKVNNSLVYNTLIMLRNHHPTIKPSTYYMSCPFSLPSPSAPGKHQSAFCLCGFSLFVTGSVGEGCAVATKKLFAFRGLGLRVPAL